MVLVINNHENSWWIFVITFWVDPLWIVINVFFIESSKTLIAKTLNLTKTLGKHSKQTIVHIWYKFHHEYPCYKNLQSCFFHLYNISRIRKYLSRKTTETLVHAFVNSRLDYCNALLYGLPNCLIPKLQHVQNAAAILIFEAPRYCHITPLLTELHWLNVKHRLV
jgi:hypothetical protein